MSSPKKRGEGTSCHHCKKRIRPNEMLKCTRGEIVPTNARKRKRPCVKKYCLHCIKTFYSEQYLLANGEGAFICPACNDECRCAACRRRVMKARLKNDGSALENEADRQSCSILESQTPDATNIEEGQVNGLLEILDSRPDVQDIIRRGMAMDFADDNAKILYVGHLIDQALTRPDVLALYYASSHGRGGGGGAHCHRGIKAEHRGQGDADEAEAAHQHQHHDEALPPDIAAAGDCALRKRKKRSHGAHRLNGGEAVHSDAATTTTTSTASNGTSGGERKKRRRKAAKNGKIDDKAEAYEAPPSAVKQEPSAVGHHLHSAAHPLALPLHRRHHHHHHHPPNAISAPQPATMSLSGGNPMGFASAAAFGPPHLGGLTLPQFPAHSAMENGSNGPALGADGRDAVTSDADGASQNGAMFPMNVTPSVMAGGPPLASM